MKKAMRNITIESPTMNDVVMILFGFIFEIMDVFGVVFLIVLVRLD